jgi:hypothetical protein
MRIVYRLTRRDGEIEIHVEDESVKAEDTAKVERLVETVHLLLREQPPHGVDNIT